MVSKKIKRIIIWCAIGDAAVTLLGIGLTLLYLWQPWWKPVLTDYYANDSVYRQTQGCISECRFEGYLDFEWIILPNGERATGDAISIRGKALQIYSPNTEKTWARLAPEKGMVISFTYGLPHYQAEFVAPIVQIYAQGEEILAFSDGKAALLEALQNYPRT